MVLSTKQSYMQDVKMEDVCSFIKDFDKALSKYRLFDLFSAIKPKEKKFEEIR
jgi:hypothetical protein